MARQNLASLSVDALLKLRDEIGAQLSRRANALKKELAALGEDYAEVGRIALYGKKKKALARRRVAAKYKHPKTGRTWSGRGAPLKEIADDLKRGKKLDDFLISKPKVAAARKQSTAKKFRRKKK
jgi:DNA-binding protein H-NS